MHRKWPFLALLFILSGCSAHRFFYQPTNRLYDDPIEHGLQYELLEIESLNGKQLSAIIFKTEQPPIGTVIHFHGNFGNVSNHYRGAQFLVNYGFDVIVFDYQGYGGSKGKPSPKRCVEDGLAVVRYAQETLRPGGHGVVIFGQSLGASVASVVAAKEPLVKAVVLESGFTSYRTMARVALGRSVLTWPLYPICPFFLGKTYDPERWVDKISPRPLLFITGNKDTIVPGRMTEQLYKTANEPKNLWIVDGAGHLECRGKNPREYEKKVADFFTAALQK